MTMTKDPRWDGLLLDACLATLSDAVDAPYGAVEDAALAWKDGRIVFAGARADLPAEPETLAAQGDWQWQPQGNTAPIALPAGHGMWWAASKTQGRLVPLEGQKQSLAALQVTFSSQIGHTSVSINEV